MFCCGFTKYQLKQYINNLMFIQYVDYQDPIELNTSRLLNLETISEIKNDWENISTPLC